MKIIEKILDNYYTKKLVDNIKFTTLPYYLDFNYIFKKDRVLIQCKKKPYKNEMYVEIIKILKKYSFSYLCEYDDFSKRIKRLINEYLESQV